MKRSKYIIGYTHGNKKLSKPHIIYSLLYNRWGFFPANTYIDVATRIYVNKLNQGLLK